MHPGFSSVGGLVHTVAKRDGGAHVSFAGAHVNDFRIRWGNCNRANRSDRLRTKNRIPGATCISRFPYATADRAEIIEIGLSGYAGHGEHASRSIRADGTPVEILEKLRSNDVCGIFWR